MDFEEFGYLILGLMRTARESSEEMIKKLVDLGKKAAEEAERITQETRKTVEKVGLKEGIRVRPERKKIEIKEMPAKKEKKAAPSKRAKKAVPVKTTKTKDRRPKTTAKRLKPKKSGEAIDQLIEEISVKK